MAARKGIDLNYLQLDQLFDVLNPSSDLAELFARMKREDLGVDGIDLTTEAMVDSDEVVEAEIIARKDATVSGLRTIPGLLDAYFGKKGGMAVTELTEDGFVVAPGDVVAKLCGPLANVLVVERPILNLMGRLCGVATLTAEYVAAVKGSNASIYDTRKTTPGLRGLEKYAVRCGGGRNHRMGLFDAMLVKDNHLAGVEAAELTAVLNDRLARIRRKRKHSAQFVEVEVDTLEQLEAVLASDGGLVDIVLLDNMGPKRLCEAVGMRDAARPEIELEASGGVNLATAAMIASTGVDRISVGAVTHSVTVLDLGLDIQ